MPNRSEAGTTLIELLVTIAIMGIAFVGVLGGIGTAIIGTDVQRKDSTSGVVLTSAAEKLTADTVTYQPCANAAYFTSFLPTTTPGFLVEVTRVSLWDGKPDASSRFVDVSTIAPCGADDDKGLQLIELTLTPAGPRSTGPEVLQVVKRRPSAP